MARIVLKPTTEKLSLVSLCKLGTAGGLPTVTGNDGYAVIEVGSVAAFRPIKQSYIVASFAVSAFGGPSTQEVGQTLTNPAFSASYNRTPETAFVQDDQGNPALDVSTTPTAFSYLHAYAKTANNATVTWNLAASEGGEIGTRATSAAWRPRVFYGIGVAGLSTEADIEGLANQPLLPSRAVTFTVAPNVGEHIYFAAPTSYGTPTFTVGGFEGGFDFVGTVSVTNIYGVTQNYDLYRSTNSDLGATTVQVS